VKEEKPFGLLLLFSNFSPSNFFFALLSLFNVNCEETIFNELMQKNFTFALMKKYGASYSDSVNSENKLEFTINFLIN